MAVACCEHTYANPAISSLPEETRRQRAAMVFCGAEFGRIGTTTPKAHPDFQVSYIGTVDPTKMHPGFVAMSSAVNVPQVRFVVCGGGGTQWLTAEAQQLGSLERFDFRGAVEDIASVLATTDVYGYPLCEDTYAAAEMNIQEAMYAGIPVVAFPHGGLKNLILHGETGLLVNSPDEYARAIEYLYQNPAERTRLGANAAAYARLHFGAEITGRGFNEVFQRMLLQPKRTRRWPDWPGDALPSELIMNPGARLFVESLGAAGRPYADSALAPTTTEKLKAEEDILSQTLLTHYCCSYGYAKTFPRDSLLQLWSGLGFMARSHFTDALEAFRQAQKNGFNHWRLNWYAAVAAEKIGQAGEAMRLLQPVLQTAPDFEPARKMQQSLPMVQLLPEQSKAALQWVQEAQRLLQARQLVQAREYLERAHNLIPEQILIIELLADLDCRLGRLDSARQLIDIIVKREPQRANPRLAAIKSALAVREKAGTPVPA
jgi:tetratricopeptide (TPR) repeat protein